MSSNLCQQSQAHRLYSLYLHYDASHTAKHDDPECKAVLKQCFALLEKDYVVGTVANHNGQLCSSYPSELAILEKARRAPTTDTATIDPCPDVHSSPSDNQNSLQEGGGQGSFSRHSAPSSHRQSSQAALDTHTRKLPSATSSSSPFFARTSNTANSDGNSLLHNNTDFKLDLAHTVDLDSSLLEETDDQSFDLGESGMMSFQDIKTELDMIHTAQSPQQRHILPFPFRIPRPEKKENVAIKEYVPSPPSADPIFSHNKKTQAPGLQMVDKDKVNDTYELSKQFEKSHFARVRARFVIPCILVRGKNICRSATLSNEVEVFMHSVNQKIIDLNQKRKMFLYGTGERSPDKEERESSLEKQRLEDIVLLHQLGVTYINDLMVENRKVKYGLKVTSSEKVDSFGRYSKFKLVATPYPGVEFFQKFKANKYSARKLCFDWSQNFADAELQLPPGHIDHLGVRWRDYKSWDLIELTQNYLRLYLTHIADDSSDQSISETGKQLPKGLLIHCISGWDRTPLFISLLRISLWADGEAHESLTAAEILYLTMGYDWFLFNQRGEDIFYFCFYFLKFIYGDEFSLSSISDTNKMGKEASRQTSRQSTPRSPLLKDIGRVRDGVFATTTPDSIDSNGPICDDCQARRRPSMGRDASSIKNSHDAASSTDGKPSSWQFVSFSTPPGRHGSPRAPFVPTLQAMSRNSGSPLGVKRGSIPSGFIEDLKSTSGDNGSPDPQHSSGGSPFTFNDRRFRLGVQQFNARRSSSSSIPGLFADESKRHQPQGALASEFARVSTSPHLLREQARREVESISDKSGAKTIPENKPSAPRKRASTFDGGLLLSSGQDSHPEHDDMDSKNGDEEEEEEEDLTSGDDENMNNEMNKANPSLTIGLGPDPKAGRRLCCQICHQPTLSGSGQGQSHLASKETIFAVSRPNAAVHAEVLDHPLQSMGINSNQPQDRSRDVGSLLNDDYSGVYRDSSVSECDREENMFQLEIDERPAYRRCSEGSELDCLDPSCLSNSGGYHDSMCNNSYAESDHQASNNSRIANDTESIEGDENESFWDEASTVDYGCSPGSLLNGFGLGLTKCEPEPGSDKENISAGISEAREIDSTQGRVESDEEDDDDGTASISSRRSSVKTDHHENDHLFAPSLEGVFSNTSRSRRRSGQSVASIPRPMYPAHSHGSGASLADQDGSSNGGARRDTDAAMRSSSEKPQKLTRRQKLKQLRRLFMDIRGEIGDGSRPPSRTLDITNAKSTVASGLDDEDEAATSLRAESFSDDSSFQYRSTMSPFARQNVAVSPSTSSSRLQDFGANQTSYRRGPLLRPYGESSIVSPTAQHQHRPQHHQRNQPSPAVPSGRKSPFEWAASFGSSATGMISGGFGQTNSGSGVTRQSPSLRPTVHPQHPVHPYQLGVSPSSGSPQLHFFQQQQQQQYQHPYHHQHQHLGFNPSSERTGTENIRRHSLVPSTTSSGSATSKLRGGPGAASGIKEKGGENSGRWDWMPGIFV
ncbi:Myotubularin- protein 14 [Linnemannia exigua]|uniref:Myotubularin- protein 14 n=1 Tax=Linnemannia exigua TaxID=604196 RepID=A0AAD4H8D7_9FUNG|nr:Myotubularin- protein 14 [Linnemannia exigua]